MCITICRRFGPDKGAVASYSNRIRAKYTAKWGVQITGMLFQTCSNVYFNFLSKWCYTYAQHRRAIARISIHTSLREATRILLHGEAAAYFNSRLSARGYWWESYFIYYSCISIHASLREATLPPWTARLIQTNFNSCLSARGYWCLGKNGIYYSISIHASLREATKIWSELPCCGSISIHASLREATADKRVSVPSIVFQFTPLCERLPALIRNGYIAVLISIHASLREATYQILLIAMLLRNFNSRLSARGYSKNRQYIAVF